MIKNVGDVIDRNFDVISTYRYCMKTWVAIFADIIKIMTRFIKKIFKYSRKAERIINYVLKFNLHLYFLIEQDLLISGEKMMMSAKVRRCIT